MADAVLEMLSFGCTSCAYTIEKLGRKVEGVDDVRVDLGTHEIRVAYDGRPEAIDAIREIVRKIGHEARVVGEQ